MKASTRKVSAQKVDRTVSVDNNNNHTLPKKILTLQKKCKAYRYENRLLRQDIKELVSQGQNYSRRDTELEREINKLSVVYQGEFTWRGKCEKFIGIVLGYMAQHRGNGSWCGCGLCQSAVKRLEDIDIVLPPMPNWGMRNPK